MGNATADVGQEARDAASAMLTAAGSAAQYVLTSAENIIAPVVTPLVDKAKLLGESAAADLGAHAAQGATQQITDTVKADVQPALDVIKSYLPPAPSPSTPPVTGSGNPGSGAPAAATSPPAGGTGANPPDQGVDEPWYKKFLEGLIKVVAPKEDKTGGDSNSNPLGGFLGGLARMVTDNPIASLLIGIAVAIFSFVMGGLSKVGSFLGGLMGFGGDATGADSQGPGDTASTLGAGVRHLIGDEVQKIEHSGLADTANSAWKAVTTTAGNWAHNLKADFDTTVSWLGLKGSDGKAVKASVVEMAFIGGESAGNPNAESYTGAAGLMQIEPDTARGLLKEMGLPSNYDDKQIKALLKEKPELNVALGHRYIAELLNQYDGNLTLATAAYNAGPGEVDKWIKEFGDPRKGQISEKDWVTLIPFQETRKYVPIIQNNLIAAEKRAISEGVLALAPSSTPNAGTRQAPPHFS